MQHELLMAILMEHLYEPGRVSPSARAPLPVGEPLPAPAKQTGALGVDHSQAPKWRVAVTVPVIQVAVESLPAPASAPGQGPSLAEVAFPLQYQPPCLKNCTFTKKPRCAWEWICMMRHNTECREGSFLVRSATICGRS